MLKKLFNHFSYYSAYKGGSLSSKPILRIHTDRSSSFAFNIKGPKIQLGQIW